MHPKTAIWSVVSAKMGLSMLPLNLRITEHENHGDNLGQARPLTTNNGETSKMKASFPAETANMEVARLEFPLEIANLPLRKSTLQSAWKKHPRLSKGWPGGVEIEFIEEYERSVDGKIKIEFDYMVRVRSARGLRAFLESEGWDPEYINELLTQRGKSNEQSKI